MRNLMLAGAVMCSGSALAQNCPARPSWPTAEWPQQLVDTQAKATQIAAMEEFAFTLTGKDSDREGLRTDGVVIIKNGQLLYEKYARGFDATKRHLSWSVAKSVSSALVGVAVQKGALSLDDSICKYASGFSGASCDIRVKDTITFGTGLRWQEGYEDESYQSSSVISMLFGVGKRDMLKHILSHEIIGAPGTKWLYSTGDLGIAASVAKNALTPGFGKDAFWDLLFDKIGMSSAVMEEDTKGQPIGGAFVYATPRDFAKFGWLFLNDGCWNDERIEPEGWVEASRTPSEVFVNSAVGGLPSGYAWWLNRPVPELKDESGTVIRSASEKPWKDVPDDMFVAIGHWGQYIYVIPSEDVVIVRVGDDRDTGMSSNTFVKLALEVVR